MYVYIKYKYLTVFYFWIIKIDKSNKTIKKNIIKIINVIHDQRMQKGTLFISY